MKDISLTLISENHTNPEGHVIFIHGLGGDGISTWMYEGKVETGKSQEETNIYFPQMLSSDFPKLNVWSLDYSAKITKWSDSSKFNELSRESNEILEYLLGKLVDDKPIILITHSLGGIIAKELLRTSKESNNLRREKFFEKVKAVSFLATPHGGSKWANVLDNINTVLPFLRMGEKIDTLTYGNAYLEGLADWYRNNVVGEIETQAFYETEKTKKIMVVEPLSANPGIPGCMVVRTDMDHINICKPSSKESPVYVSIYGLILYHFPDKSAITVDSESHSSLRHENIVIGIVKKGDQVLMVKRKENPDNLTWQFVGGRLKYGESEIACIEREIKEETDVTARAKEKLGLEEGGAIPVVRHYYACDYLHGTAINLDLNENEDVAWVDIKNIEQYVTTTISSYVKDYLNIENKATL